MQPIDPVCGMHVEPEKAAAKLDHEGTTYYFCSAACSRAFAENPAKYVTEAATDAHGNGGCCGGASKKQPEKVVRGHHGGGCCRS